MVSLFEQTLTLEIGLLKMEALTPMENKVELPIIAGKEPARLF